LLQNLQQLPKMGSLTTLNIFLAELKEVLAGFEVNVFFQGKAA
jgi:hypothetical protein